MRITISVHQDKTRDEPFWKLKTEECPSEDESLFSSESDAFNHLVKLLQNLSKNGEATICLK